jgi:ribosomal protein S18 acetylase RimI-like enzyme
MATVSVRPYDPSVDEPWATEVLDAELGGRWQARRGVLHDVLAAGLGVVAEVEGQRVGLLTYRFEPDGRTAELSAMVASPRQQGVGSAMLEAFVTAIRTAGRSHIWVLTTNDNLGALRFYQRRGFRLAAVRPGGVDEARRTLKPAIGKVGEYGIPLRDEIELELELT